MWYAIYAWQGESGWKLQNVFEDSSPDLARGMALLAFDGEITGSLALVEADTREVAESYPQYDAGWRRLSIMGS